MSEYHKIQTIFKRDPDNNYKTLLEGEYSKPEFDTLKDIGWVATEKVDGTNIRVYYNLGAYGDVSFRGRTDRADIPPFLLSALEDMFTMDTLMPVFGEESKTAILYGEGYGPKIQKGGGNYRDDPSFVLFDVKVGDTYLERHNVEDIANSLGIDVVPTLFTGTLNEVVEFVRPGFKSAWGDFQAEGVVARPKTELQDRFGKRIIAKLKCKDFQ